MKYFILLCVGLAGCAEIPNPNIEIMVRTDIAARVARFNVLRNVSMPVPDVVFSSAGGDYAETSTYRGAAIIINPDRCAADVDDCLNDTDPHELAHWALTYYGYYTQREDITASPHAGRAPLVHKEQQQASHDGIWCDTMRAFGGVPEKHGYCH
jgi:hypothetical protein